MFKGFLLVFIVLSSLSGFAEEVGEEEEQAKKGFMKAGLSPEELKYNDHILELNQQEGEIERLEAEFKKLVKQKNMTTDTKAIRDIVKKMKQTKMERDELTTDYNSRREMLKYKFPDKGRAFNRRYAPMQKKSMEQLEKPNKFNEELSEIKRMVDRKYKPFVEEARERERLEQAKVFIRPKVAPSDAPPPKKAIRFEQ